MNLMWAICTRLEGFGNYNLVSYGMGLSIYKVILFQILPCMIVLTWRYRTTQNRWHGPALAEAGEALGKQILPKHTFTFLLHFVAVQLNTS